MSIHKGLSMAVIGAALLALTLVPTASAMRRAGVIVRPLDPYYPYYTYRYYSPAWYYPGRYAYFPPAPATGEVKIDTHLKGGSIYIDGGYAGETSKLKKFSLRPGNHDIEVRDPAGNTMYRERVQVLAGKTTEIKLAG